MRTQLWLAVATAIVVLTITAPAKGDVPSLISYQGHLTSSAGVPLNTTLGLVFTLYADSAGTTLLWSETQPTVTVTDGLFQVLLGSVNPIGSGVFGGERRWLKVQIEGGAVVATPIPIVSVAYAYRAAKSDTANYALSGAGGSGNGWTDDGNDVRLITNADNVGIGISSPDAKLHIRNESTTINAVLISNESASNPEPALWVETSGNAAAIRASSPMSYGVHASSANSYGVYGTGSKGIYGYHIDSRHYGYLGGSTAGVFGKDSTTGVWGAIGGGNSGVYGEGNSKSSFGLYGYNTGGGIGIIGGSADSMGVYGSSASKYGVYGTGSKGVFGLHPGTNHYGFLGGANQGVFGKDSTTGVWGALGGGNAGVYGEAQTTNSNGVYGYNTAAGVGVRGGSVDSCGVHGSSARDFGVLGTGVRGVYGLYLTNGNYGYLGSSDYGAYGEYEDSTNWGGLGGVFYGLSSYSRNGYGTYSRSDNGIGVLGFSNDSVGVYAVSYGGDALSAQATEGSGKCAGKFFGPVKMEYYYNSTTDPTLEVDGNTLLNKNDGELVLRTPTQGDPGRYRIKFDNNNLGVICGNGSDNQTFSFMSEWGANRKYDAQVRAYGSATASWGTYIQLSHDGTDGYVTTDVGDIVMSPALNVGIGTSTPAYKLDVAGSCHASSFPTSSDVRLKTNITQLTDVLEKLAKIRGVAFDWNETYDSLGRSTGHREIGVVAQEVEEQFPELVTKWGDKEYRAVDYGRLTAVLIEAIKELKAENDDLQKRIAALEKR